MDFKNPYAQEYPESLDRTLHDRVACAVRFNPTGSLAGSLLAVGCQDGSTYVMDMQTQTKLRHWDGDSENIAARVTLLSWSRNSRFLLSSGRDWQISVWDLKNDVRREKILCDSSILCASLHPRNSYILLYTLADGQSILHDLRPEFSLRRLIGQQERTDDLEMDGSQANIRQISCSTFHPSGRMIFSGTTTGHMIIQRTSDLKTLVNTRPCNSSIKSIDFDRTAQHITLICNDRSIRVMNVPQDLSIADDHAFKTLHKFQDVVTRTPWQRCTFSADSEFVMAGAGAKGEHTISIWDRVQGTLIKVLEGPKEDCEDVDWHPIKPLILSATCYGSMFIWASPTQQKWSAFAPGFVELEENLEYDEPEDEFDQEDSAQKDRRKKGLDSFLNIKVCKSEFSEETRFPPLHDDDMREDSWSAQIPDEDDNPWFFPSVNLLPIDSDEE